VVNTKVRPHLARILVAGFALLVLAAALLDYPTHSRAADAAASPSSNVAVVPGFTPTPYSGFSGVPALPVNLLPKYHFTQLSASAVTPAALQNYDTVVLYGIRWSDIPSSGQAAINAFAAKHKVVIWDADATGAQAYSSFVHPFSTVSSGQSQGTDSTRESVVYFLKRGDFLASSNPKSPYYLDPTQLVRDHDELNDMNAMKAGTANWRPALLAANDAINPAAWPIAWSYGVIGDQTGMTIYSGLDADTFPTNEVLNNDRKELALDLAAPFRSTPAACSPGCHLGSSPETNPFASCEFLKLPKHWAHGHVPLVLKTSDAANITAQILTHSGRVLATGPATDGLVPLVLPTTKLPNGTSRLRARVLVHGAPACSNRFRLAKSNSGRLRLLLLATSRDPVVHEPDQLDLLTLRTSETASFTIVAPHYRRTRLVRASKVVQFSVPLSVRKATVILRDRAGNTVTRSVSWG
jgi:hypothetical protein